MSHFRPHPISKGTCLQSGYRILDPNASNAQHSLLRPCNFAFNHIDPIPNHPVTWPRKSIAMEEELDFIYDSSKEAMQNALDRMATELLKVRAGKASPAMLESVRVDYYGAQTPLKSLANINTPDPKTITIQPFEKGLIQEIEKAIMRANLGFNPQNDGKLVRISIPPLTEERRRDLVKQAKAIAEQAKVSIRNARKDANDSIKTLKNDGLSEDIAKAAEAEVQDYTAAYSTKVEALLAEKEVDIMTI
jgi:ribosome recycling factor